MNHLDIELLRLACDREPAALHAPARTTQVHGLPGQRVQQQRRLLVGGRLSVMALAALLADLLPWHR